MHPSEQEVLGISNRSRVVPSPLKSRRAETGGAQATRAWRSALLAALAILAVPVLMGENACETVEDADGDGYPVEEDCDDHNPSVYPGAVEICNGLDDSCDGAIDEGITQLWYVDADQDGLGDSTTGIESCASSPDRTTDGGDCDDQNAARHPGAIETCNGLDDNCDGLAEDASVGSDLSPVPRVSYYRDIDGDGFGDNTRAGCEAQDGLVLRRGDCNDLEPNVHPGASDSPEDGVDSDCGGHDAADPHVGLSTDSFEALSGALGAVMDGTLLWVGPGDWPMKNQVLPGRQFRLLSTDQAGATALFSDFTGPIFSLSGNVGLSREVNGFTLRNGYTGSSTLFGGAVNVSASSLTLRGCVLRENSVNAFPSSELTTMGGALYAAGSAITVQETAFLNNAAYDWGPYTNYECNFCSQTGSCSAWDEYYLGEGGGMAVEGSSVRLEQVHFSNNLANNGGGLYARQSTLRAGGLTFSGNTAATLAYCSFVSPSACSLQCVAQLAGGNGPDTWLVDATLDPL